MRIIDYEPITAVKPDLPTPALVEPAYIADEEIKFFQTYYIDIFTFRPKREGANREGLPTLFGTTRQISCTYFHGGWFNAITEALRLFNACQNRYKRVSVSTLDYDSCQLKTIYSEGTI